MPSLRETGTETGDRRATELWCRVLRSAFDIAVFVGCEEIRFTFYPLTLLDDIICSLLILSIVVVVAVSSTVAAADICSPCERYYQLCLCVLLRTCWRALCSDGTPLCSSLQPRSSGASSAVAVNRQLRGPLSSVVYGLHNGNLTITAVVLQTKGQFHSRSPQFPPLQPEIILCIGRGVLHKQSRMLAIQRNTS